MLRMTRHQLDHARDLRAGCVYLAYSQRTGALRGVYRAHEAGIDGEGWATVCEDHGTFVLSDTRALALASDTDDFCDDCRAAADAAAAAARRARRDEGHALYRVKR